MKAEIRALGADPKEVQAAIMKQEGAIARKSMLRALRILDEYGEYPSFIKESSDFKGFIDAVDALSGSDLDKATTKALYYLFAQATNDPERFYRSINVRNFGTPKTKGTIHRFRR